MNRKIVALRSSTSRLILYLKNQGKMAQIMIQRWSSKKLKTKRMLNFQTR
jgi:hypothetical protein